MFTPVPHRAAPLAGSFAGKPHAVVIGSGFGGLAAAVRLGARGYRVTVLEKLDAPGGRAYVLSNIARDVGDDARMGRIYLPRAWLVEAGIAPNAWLAEPVFSPALGAVVQRLLDPADALCRRVDAGVARLPLACRPGINAARFLYAEIGHEVARAGGDSVARRARVPAARKGWLLLRALAQLAPPLAANRFLVEAALGSAAAFVAVAMAPQPPRRSIAERVVWTAELFVRLDQRGALGTSRSAT